jgi:hypothetical protein
MHFQIDVAAPAQPGAGPPAAGDAVELLRQLLEVQREQTVLLRMLVAAHDAGARWRAVLARFQADFPALPAACKLVLPTLERSCVELVAELTDQLKGQGTDALENEYALADFLDRYGPRLGQLATVINVVAPIADAQT